MRDDIDEQHDDGTGADYEPTALEEARSAIQSELGTITADSAEEAQTHAAACQALADLLRMHEIMPEAGLLRDVAIDHPAEPFVRTARVLLEIEVIRNRPGIARVACAHERLHWQIRAVDIARVGVLW